MPKAFYPPNIVATCRRCGRPTGSGPCGACGYDASTGLGAPIRCAGCGYDLRGSVHACPECGRSLVSAVAAARQTTARHALWRAAARRAVPGAVSLLLGALFTYLLWAGFDGHFRGGVFWMEVLVSLALTCVGVVCVVKCLHVLTSRVS